MDETFDIPQSGYTVRPVVDGNAILLGDALTMNIVEAVASHNPIVEMWVLWKRAVGNIALLRRFHDLQRLHIINRTSAKLSEISELKGLRVLTVESDSSFDVDLSFWPDLEELLFFWKGSFCNLDQARKLGTLRVWSWKKSDLHYLGLAPQLCNLELVGGSLRTLDGIGSCHHLEKLALSHAAKLEDFESIKSLKSLRILNIDTCRRLNNINFLLTLPRLESLYLDNVGAIESLAPLSTVRTLRKLFFRGSTNILDGDTDIVNRLSLVDFGFQNRRHYNYCYDHSKPRIERLRSRTL